MNLNRTKLERAVIFTIKYNACVVPLIFLQKTLIWNKMVLHALNSMTVLEQAENALEKTFSENISQSCFLHLIY